MGSCSVGLGTGLHEHALGLPQSLGIAGEQLQLELAEAVGGALPLQERDLVEHRLDGSAAERRPLAGAPGLQGRGLLQLRSVEDPDEQPRQPLRNAGRPASRFELEPCRRPEEASAARR